MKLIFAKKNCEKVFGIFFLFIICVLSFIVKIVFGETFLLLLKELFGKKNSQKTFLVKKSFFWLK